MSGEQILFWEQKVPSEGSQRPFRSTVGKAIAEVILEEIPPGPYEPNHSMVGPGPAHSMRELPSGAPILSMLRAELLGSSHSSSRAKRYTCSRKA